jgi:hypothetical protein
VAKSNRLEKERLTITQTSLTLRKVSGSSAAALFEKHISNVSIEWVCERTWFLDARKVATGKGGKPNTHKAKLVSGPTATIVIESLGFSLRSRSISLCAGTCDALKDVVGLASSRASATSSALASAAGGWNSVFQASDGER